MQVDQGQLEQVIINLAVNARDAMPQGGALTIRTAQFRREAPVRRGAEVMPPGEYVRIEVDRHRHRHPARRSSIASSNLSSRPRRLAPGPGLGLSTVYGIVRQTGGFVFVTASSGRAPRSNLSAAPRRGEDGPAARRDAEAAEPARDLTGIGTILLVEDEDAVRLFGARALRNKGYDVIEARSGEEALSLIPVIARSIDLLITDVVMPRMDGPGLIRAVRERRPEMKVIYISGYAEDAFRKRLDETGAINFLPKPFSLKQLAGKVKEVMEAPNRPEAEDRVSQRNGCIQQSLTLRN